jgi:hypothetical protein
MVFVFGHDKLLLLLLLLLHVLLVVAHCAAKPSHGELCGAKAATARSQVDTADGALKGCEKWFCPGHGITCKQNVLHDQVHISEETPFLQHNGRQTLIKMCSRPTSGTDARLLVEENAKLVGFRTSRLM